MKKLLFALLFLPVTAFGALTDGLVSYWPFDESSGNAIDAHGANDLINFGSVPYVTGKLGNAGDIEASDSNYFYIGDTADLSITGDMTIGGWVNLESGTQGEYVSKRSGTGNQRSYDFAISGTTLIFNASVNGTTVSETSVSTSNSNGTWYHIFVVYDASAGESTFYKNGVQISTPQGGLPTSIYNSSSDFCVGCLFSPAQDFIDGKVDEIGIWNRELSEAEIQALYNGGAGFAYPFYVPPVYGCTNPSNPVNYNPSATVDDGSCYIVATTTIETIATTTNFGLAIIITILSFGVIGFIWNTINTKKKPWMK